MALTLSNAGISSGSLIEAAHVSQSIDALTGVEAYDITISGSLTTTGSVYFNGLGTSSATNILTYNPSTKKIFNTSSFNWIPGTALTASYVNLVAGPNININQVGTAFGISASLTSSYAPFNNFTGSYNTGSFTGSFTGSLLGTASYINLVAGPNIEINHTNNVFEITQSININNLNGVLITASLDTGSIKFTKYDNSTFNVPIPYPPYQGYLYDNIPIGNAPFNPLQLSGGHVKVATIAQLVTPSLPETVVFYLPTSSINIGDTIEIFVHFSPNIIP